MKRYQNIENLTITQKYDY